MLSLIRKDIKLVTFGTYNKIFLVVFVPVLMAMSGFDFTVKYMYMAIVLSFAYMLVLTSFSYDVQFKTNLYVQSLPTTKSEIVRGKYVFSLLAFLFSMIYSSLYLGLLNIFTSLNFDLFDINTMKNSFILFLILISFVVPLNYKLPPKIASFFGVFTYVFLINTFAMSTTDVEEVFNHWLFSLYGGLFGILIGLGLIILSTKLSIYLYGKRA